MKLISLHINNYKQFHNFDINFAKDISIIIGINGSGKSTILEFISNAFYDLYSCYILKQDLKQKLFFNIKYKIEYNSNSYLVNIDSHKDKKTAFDIIVQKEIQGIQKYSTIQVEKEFANGYKDILPNNLVIYYSGISEILKNKFIVFQNSFIDRSIQGDVKIDQPFFYFLSANYQAILIGLLCYEYGEVPEILLNKFGISGFKEIIIKLKKPSWAKSGPYWGARGDLKVFLENLQETSYFNTHEIGLTSFLLINQIDLQKIWGYYGEEKKLFEYLVTLQANDLVESIDVILKKNNKEISCNRLSEGEKQLLVIYGLKELLITGNTLFLLDEPDNYLHPTWQRNFIESISQISQDNPKVKHQYIITTHSPLLLSNALPETTEVQIIEDGSIVKITPKYYGRDISMIYYEMMGVEKRNQKISNALNNLFNLIEDEKLEVAKTEYKKLSGLIGEDDPVILNAKTQLEYLEEAINEKNNKD